MRRSFVALGLATLVAFSVSLRAQTLVVTPTGNGNASLDGSFTGSLGFYFTVNTSVSVSSVGYWDTGNNGVQGGATIKVGIFNVTTPGAVPGTEIDFTGTTGSLTGSTYGGGQFRVASLSSPVTLTAGVVYAIMAQGFNASNQYINHTDAGNASAFDTVGGALTLQGSYYDMSATPSLLLGPDQTGTMTTAQWLAPTFVATAIPEPGTTALFTGLASATAALIALRRRAKPARAV